MKIPQLGHTIEITNNGMNDGEVVQAGGVLVDGLGIGDVGTVVLRDRRHLSQDGLVVVVVTMASGEGELLGMPEIISRGFIYVKDNDELITDAKKVVIDVIERQHNLSGGDWTNLKNPECAQAYDGCLSMKRPSAAP